MHGRRRTYQTDKCRCPACRAANTAYERSYRAAVRVGRRPLGAHVAGTAVTAAIAALLRDGYTRGQIAAALGYATRRLQYGATVTVRTHLRLRRLLRDWTA